eukprot:GHVT01076241.1.p1 GENE.GHVT01076241.1~~GHVT01076241.1.p1  ORF type:complete len:1109 (+),score=311.31 GHVT01076241.1:42-3329(+)
MNKGNISKDRIQKQSTEEEMGKDKKENEKENKNRETELAEQALKLQQTREKELLVILEDMPLINKFTVERQEKLLKRLRVEFVLPGSPIVLEGEEVRECFFLLSGRCYRELWQGPGRKAQRKDTFHAANLFGHVHILDGINWDASVIAETHARILRCPRATFLEEFADAAEELRTQRLGIDTVADAQTEVEELQLKLPPLTHEESAVLFPGQQSLGPEVGVAFLQSVKMFEALPQPVLLGIAQEMELYCYTSHEVIYTEGDSCPSLLLHYSGEIRLSSLPPGEPWHVAQGAAAPGAFLEPTAFLRRQPHEASAVAHGDEAKVISLSASTCRLHLSSLAAEFGAVADVPAALVFAAVDFAPSAQPAPRPTTAGVEETAEPTQKKKKSSKKKNRPKEGDEEATEELEDGDETKKEGKHQKHKEHSKHSKKKKETILEVEAPETIVQKQEEQILGKLIKKEKNFEKNIFQDKTNETEAQPLLASEPTVEECEQAELIFATLRASYPRLIDAYEVMAQTGDDRDLLSFRRFVRTHLNNICVTRGGARAAFHRLAAPTAGQPAVLSLALLYAQIDGAEPQPEVVEGRLVEVFGSIRNAFKEVGGLNLEDACDRNTFVRVLASVGVAASQAENIWTTFFNDDAPVQSSLVEAKLGHQKLVRSGSVADLQAVASRGSAALDCALEDPPFVMRAQHRAHPVEVSELLAVIGRTLPLGFLNTTQRQLVVSFFVRFQVEEATKVVEEGEADAPIVWISRGQATRNKAGLFGYRQVESGPTPLELLGLAEATEHVPAESAVEISPPPEGQAVYWTLSRDAYVANVHAMVCARKEIVAELAQLLQHECKFFADWPVGEIHAVAQLLKAESVVAGQTIMRVPRHHGLWLLLVSGRASVLLPERRQGGAPGTLKRSRTLRRGDCFGMRQREEAPRNTVVVADTEAVICWLSSTDMSCLPSSVSSRLWTWPLASSSSSASSFSSSSSSASSSSSSSSSSSASSLTVGSKSARRSSKRRGTAFAVSGSVPAEVSSPTDAQQGESPADGFAEGHVDGAAQPPAEMSELAQGVDDAVVRHLPRPLTAMPERGCFKREKKKQQLTVSFLVPSSS